ncbi:MAG: NAD(P)H-dependent oxidoreductase subunit E [Candidatus Eremiobacteraeota bacterium]|nr:NAD(P)H-dependent oxidoreductase subunit E [Candidatus Eremiobacteraeota bacterium]
MSPKREQRGRALIEEHGNAQGALIPFLQYCQEEDGYVTAQAISDAATLIGMTDGQVESIASFYSLLFQRPVGKHIIQVCRTLSCMLGGADQLQDHIRARLDVRNGETTPDGLFTYEEVECLAACDKAPCLQHNLQYHYNVTADGFDRLLERWRAEPSTVAMPAE